MPRLFTSNRSLQDLITSNADSPKNKAKRSRVSTILTRKNLRRFKFLVQSSENYSSPEGHLVSLIYPTINLLDVYQQARGRNPVNLPVKIWCTCPAWRYYGAAYNSTQQGYNLEKKEFRSPDVRDPERKYLACKHVHAVRGFIGGRSFRQLITLYARAYQDKVGLGRKSSIDSDMPWVSWNQTLFAVSNALFSMGYSSDVVSSVITSLTEDNYEDILVQHGVFIQ